MRRIEFGWGLSLTGELAATVTLVAYAYGAGGTVLVAAYSASRTLAGMCVTLGLSGMLGRVPRRDSLLRWLTGTRVALLALAALTAALGGPPAAVVALAAAASSLAGTYRPVQALILPWLIRTPAELASANAMATVLENSGALAGPLLAGVLLAVGPAWIPMALAAGLLGLATLSLRRLAVPVQPAGAARGPGSVMRDAARGLAELSRVAPPAGMAVLEFAQTCVRGVLLVLVAVLAVHTLGLGDSAVGWLNAAIGVGGLAGGALAATLVRVTRLGRSFIVGVLLWGLPLVMLALVPAMAVAYLAFAVIGVGNAMEDAAGVTLVLRSVSPRIAGRVMGAVEFIAQAGVATGSVAAPLLLRGMGMRATLAVLGAALVGLALAHTRRFAHLDAAFPPPGEEVGLLRRLAMFAPLPLAVIELLATDLEPHEFPPGTVAVREDEPGAQFHLIVDGTALVTVRGGARPPLARGDCFGEIALLRDIPRTATVVAGQHLRTMSLDREAFLFAVTGNSESSAAAQALAARRLAAGPASNPDAPGGR